MWQVLGDDGNYAQSDFVVSNLDDEEDGETTEGNGGTGLEKMPACLETPLVEGLGACSDYQLMCSKLL